MLQVGILLYDQVEVLDFAGPFEVFSTAARVSGRECPDRGPAFEVSMVGEGGEEIQARGGLAVRPRFRFGDHPLFDLLLVPGGVVEAELEKPGVVAWIAEQAMTARIVASVCTGAFLLGRAGLLKGRRVTTHWEDAEDLRQCLAASQVVEGPRWVDEGPVVTSAGISAGLDMSLHLVERLAGKALALRTARQMDYRWQDEP